jgi:hypothetical protein
LSPERRQALFERVDALVARSPSLVDLRHHGVELLAARTWHERGREVPDELRARKRLAAARALAVTPVLERVRAASEGPLLLMKGPEVAALYLDPAARSFRDVDVIVRDAPDTQRRLLSAGFVETGDPKLFEGIHHLRPLQWPGLPLVVEVHHRPKWVDSLAPPVVDELMEGAVPCRAGVRGVLAPSPAHHAVMMAAHAWAHRPLSRLRDLIDVALLAGEADPDELRKLARCWGVQKVWATTTRAVDALLGTGRRPASISIWARHLPAAREQTVLESHVQNSLSALWGLPGAHAIAAAAGAVGADLTPGDDERWPAKLTRSRTALANAFVRKSKHDEALDAARGGS